MSVKKCHFANGKVEFLGHEINGATGTYTLAPRNAQAIRDYPNLKTRTDSFAWAGGLLGLVAAGLLLPEGGPGWAAAMIGGSGVGSALGVLAHVASRPAEQVYPNKALHELMRDD